MLFHKKKKDNYMKEHARKCFFFMGGWGKMWVDFHAGSSRNSDFLGRSFN